jgi:hypothetical protein
MTPTAADQRAAAERWFEAQGLPYFVDHHREALDARLRPARLRLLLAVALVAGAVVGAVTGWLLESVSDGVLVGTVVLGLLVLLYGVTALRVRTMAGWAVRQTFGSLESMFPLVTRALPLLLLFITFLFINAEVWQVAADMSRGVLWTVALLFAGVAVAFLLVRLPEEVRHVERDTAGDHLLDCCTGTPLEEAARRLPVTTAVPALPRLPRLNLVLVVLFSQVLQVLLLAVAVFAFFLVFGRVAITADVVESWVGHEPQPILELTRFLPISNELLQVSVFLAAFSGLYFTVYAVTDETYRTQFFTAVSDELERAIGVHAVYRSLAAGPVPYDGEPGPPTG